MQLKIVPIGNSQGVRIPKSLLDQLGFTDTVELKIEDKGLRLSTPHPRANWRKTFETASNDEAIDEAIDEVLKDFNDIDIELDEDWQW